MDTGRGVGRLREGPGEAKGEPMLVRVLGEVSLTAADGTGVALPGSRQPALLAALAARAGEVVGADRLVDLLWPQDPPENPAAALHSAVFKLRASLARASGRDVLLTRERGYQLDVGPDDLDAAAFTSAVERARDLPPDEAAGVLTQALALWRGRAYGSFADSEVAHLEALRLEELRRSAVERCGDALVAAGRPGEAVLLLQPFVAEHPLREAARISLMRALHAAGRTPDALEQYHEHRGYLAEELGLEPSPAIREVQARLLTAQPSPAGDRGGTSRLRVHYLRTDRGNVLAHCTGGRGPRVVASLGWVSSLDVVASGRDPRSSLVERLTDDLEVTMFDRAGTGLSPGPVADYGLEASVTELAEIVRAVGPPVTLLAMSGAGPSALALAHRRPEWVDSLVLFGTFADAPGTFTDARLREMVVEITRTHWGMGSKILADLYRPGLSDEAAWHLAKVLRDSAEPEVAAAYLEALYDQDVSALLPEITTPALVLHYRSDRLIRFRGGQQLATGLPDATFLPLEGKVHLPDAADLDLVQEAIVSHVRRHATRRPHRDLRPGVT
jgi:DNA-binding SARP family transcriptional activator/pimeloyl-ACP methyl ester carboxylesterase